MLDKLTSYIRVLASQKIVYVMVPGMGKSDWLAVHVTSNNEFSLNDLEYGIPSVALIYVYERGHFSRVFLFR